MTLQVEQLLEPTERLKQDVRAAAINLSPQEVRYLVDYYYIMQEDRKRAGNQKRALEKTGEPHSVVAWTFLTTQFIERNLKGVLQVYAEQSLPGRWAMSICGIGPIIASGLLAHVDIEVCPTVGKIWRFAGLDPTVEWKEHQKRPWNARLKVICWHIGESFVKQQNNAKDIYGKLYVARKAYEWARNERGKLADQAAAKLARYKIDKSKDAYKWYSGQVTVEEAHRVQEEFAKGNRPTLQTVPLGEGLPMLPPGHIQSRAKRWVTKLFLAHYHHVAYECRFGSPPPLPYVLEHIPGHHDMIGPPNWPME